MGELQPKLKKDGTPDKRYKPKKIASLNPTRLEEQIKEYFEETDPLEWSVPSLCLYLHMTKNMFNKLKDEPNFASVYEFAMNNIEAALFRDLKTAKNPTGAIFALKTLGYSDRRGIDVTMAGSISIERVLKDAVIKA